MTVDDDISNYYASSSTLKPDDIEDHTSYTIEGWRSRTWDDGNTSVYLKLVGKDAEFRVNATNAKRIASLYGTKMNAWKGKSVVLFVDKVRDPRGGLVDSIIVSVPRAKKTTISRPDHDLDDEIPF